MRTLNDQVSFLLQRYVDSTCTPDEFAELMALLQLEIDTPGTDTPGIGSSGIDSRRIERPGIGSSGIDTLGIEEVLDRALAGAGINPAEQQVDWEKMRLSILKRQPPAVPVKRLFPFRKMVAAAVILALLGGGGYWMLRRKAAPEERIALQPQKDVLPGGNKAILTLSNGSSIILDSAANGLLSQQGQSKVLKLTNGQLAYRPAEEKTAALLYNTVRTPRGGTYQVTLSDGTKVWLNAASSLRFPTAFPGKERRVEVSGEAYFDVAKNPGQPFRVTILSEPSGENRGEIEVLGTSFNINAYSDEKTLATTLLSGAVKYDANGQEELLRPGQQAVFDNSARTLSLRQADTVSVVAWKNGRFEFENMELPEILRQISRWYDVDIRYNGHIGNAQFGGGLSRQLSLEKVLHYLESTGMHFTLDRNVIIVSP